MAKGTRFEYKSFVYNSSFLFFIRTCIRVCLKPIHATTAFHLNLIVTDKLALRILLFNTWLWMERGRGEYSNRINIETDKWTRRRAQVVGNWVEPVFDPLPLAPHGFHFSYLLGSPSQSFRQVLGGYWRDCCCAVVGFWSSSTKCLQTLTFYLSFSL